VSKYEVVKLDELDRIPVSGAGVMWRPVRRRLGITAFGINAYTGDTGENVVVNGRARFELDGESVDAPAGTLVFLPEPTAERYAVAEEPGTTVLAIGGKPGLHEISAWEYFFAAYSHAERGDFERAIADMNEGLAEQPDHPALHYHLACIESRAGHVDEARRHLDRALELDPALRKWADEDEDLAQLRSPPEA
jgi:tetratricopeptide (TPR) repeat protein